VPPPAMASRPPNVPGEDVERNPLGNPTAIYLPDLGSCPAVPDDLYLLRGLRDCGGCVRVVRFLGRRLPAVDLSRPRSQIGERNRRRLLGLLESGFCNLYSCGEVALQRSGPWLPTTVIVE
jgi:hypothetical protein